MSNGKGYKMVMSVHRIATLATIAIWGIIFLGAMRAIIAIEHHYMGACR